MGVVGLGAAYAIYLVEAYRVAVSGVGAHDALCRAGPRDEMLDMTTRDHLRDLKAELALADPVPGSLLQLPAHCRLYVSTSSRAKDRICTH